jgi:hypothetical protein
MSLSITITVARQIAGATAAANAANAARPLDENGNPIGPELTPEQYLQDVVEKACESYRDAYAVDRITSSDFIYRFTAAEMASINASTDPVIQGFIAQVKAEAYVWLASNEVAAGMAYAVGEGLLTQARADAILAY